MKRGGSGRAARHETRSIRTNLERLHERNILRYRLRTPQLDAWQELAARR